MGFIELSDEKIVCPRCHLTIYVPSVLPLKVMCDEETEQAEGLAILEVAELVFGKDER